MVEVPRLSRPKLWGLLVCLLLIFAFGFEPVWEHPFQLDQSIIWRYLPIPFAVTGLLLLEGKLNPRGLFLDILDLTLVKLGLTGCFATMIFDDPHGLVSLGCTVHPEEAKSYLAVMDHPFGAVTGADGEFEFVGVPRRAVVIRGWSPNHHPV